MDLRRFGTRGRFIVVGDGEHEEEGEGGRDALGWGWEDEEGK